jgi:hypothetical protein
VTSSLANALTGFRPPNIYLFGNIIVIYILAIFFGTIVSIVDILHICLLCIIFFGALPPTPIWRVITAALWCLRFIEVLEGHSATQRQDALLHLTHIHNGGETLQQ